MNKKELARYIADYINAEWVESGARIAYGEQSIIRMQEYAQPVDTDMILEAIESYEGVEDE